MPVTARLSNVSTRSWARIWLNELNFARFDTKLEQRLAELRAELRQEIAELRAELHGLGADLLRWMFAFWATTLLTLAGLMIALRGP
jgi:hypothetical protein